MLVLSFISTRRLCPECHSRQDPLSSLCSRKIGNVTREGV